MKRKKRHAQLNARISELETALERIATFESSHGPSDEARIARSKLEPTTPDGEPFWTAPAPWFARLYDALTKRRRNRSSKP